MSRPTRDPGARWVRFAPLGIVVLAAGAYVLWWQLTRDADHGPPPRDAADPRRDIAGGAAGAAAPRADPPADAERAWREATGAPPRWPDGFEREVDCVEAVRELEALSRRLDELPIVEAWRLPGGTFGLITGAVRDLAARPPEVEGTLTSLDAVRASVSHMFRVLGPRRLSRLAELHRQRPGYLEPLALTTYRWMRAGERCPADAPRPPDLRTQYAYAAFLVQTIGGQAYLRRRLPREEALATFYALLVLDHARARGHDPFAVDYATEIERSRDLLARRDDLVFRDRYLELLREIETRAPR